MRPEDDLEAMWNFAKGLFTGFAIIVMLLLIFSIIKL